MKLGPPRDLAGPAIRTGAGAPGLAISVGGHFGEFLQGRLGPGGPLALVTLPAPDLRVSARLLPGPFGLHGARLLDRTTLAAIWRRFRAVPRGGLHLAADMPPGGGAGSSTAALVAAARLAAAALGGPAPDAGRLALLCLGLEGATDPLMHDRPARLLWAPRAARVLAAVPPPPPLALVGGFLGPGERTDPGDLDFADIADLVAAWAPAAGRGDLAALAAVASESARRNAARRGGAPLAALEAAAARLGALGLVVAHTGSARGLIFAPGRATPEAEAALRAMGMHGVRRYRLGDF